MSVPSEGSYAPSALVPRLGSSLRNVPAVQSRDPTPLQSASPTGPQPPNSGSMFVGPANPMLLGSAYPPPRTVIFDQLVQIKQSLMSAIHDDLVDKVDDAVVQRLLKVSDQLEGLAARYEHRVSIAVPPLQMQSARNTGGESPNIQPVSAHSRIKSIDLNDIPTYGVDSTGNPASGDVSPVLSANLPKRTKSVVFFKHQDPTNSDDEGGHRFVARSYSGFGSFRKASRHASMRAGNLLAVRTKALSFYADGMPMFDLNSGAEASIRTRFSRPISRHTVVFADPAPFIDECTALSTITPIDVDDANVDLLIIDAEEGDILRSVAVQVFAHYHCMRPELCDTTVFLQFVDAVARYNNVTNPFRNGVHTAETLLGVHQYLSQPDVGNNFSDSEITSLLIAALCVNLGYLGVTNEFLLQLHHPLSRIFSLVNTSESVSTMIGLQLLEQYNFLARTCRSTDVYWLGIQEGVAELLRSSSPRSHQHQLKQALAMAERGFVADEEVPMLLSCVLRAAMMRFCCKPRQQHIRYAELWVNEAYKQAECERIMEFSEEPQWTNDTAWGSLQTFVTVVAVPYFDTLQDFLPEAWAEQLTHTKTLYGTPDAPIANRTASFRGGCGDGSVSVEIDPNVPEWSDQSSLTLNILTTIIPQHLLLNTTSGRIGTASRQRMDHYFSFLQLYDTCERDVIRTADFGGNLVQLAMRLDPLYIGEYASALIDEEDFSTYTDAASMIMRTEVTPDTSAVMSPARRTFQSSDAFILLLLRMMHERTSAATASVDPGVDSTSSTGPGRQHSSCSNSFGGGSSQNNVTGVLSGRSSINAGVVAGPFRGKWRLIPNNSVYETPRQK